MLLYCSTSGSEDGGKRVDGEGAFEFGKIFEPSKLGIKELDLHFKFLRLTFITAHKYIRQCLLFCVRRDKESLFWEVFAYFQIGNGPLHGGGGGGFGPQ